VVVEEEPLSPLFGPRKPSTPATTSTLGRLEPPPPLVLPPPPAFDHLSAASPQAQPQQPLAQPQQPQQQRVSLAPMLMEDLTLTFTGSGSSGEVRVALEGHVQLGVIATAGATSTEAEALPPLEVDVVLSDRAGQVAASMPSPAAAALFVVKAEQEQPFAAIPETKDDTAAEASPPPSYRCRIPLDRFTSSSSSSAAPLALIRYDAKPSVRPVPVRIQQSLVRVEAGEPGVAHVVAQVNNDIIIKSETSATSRTDSPLLHCRWPSTPRSSCPSSPPPSPASSSSRASTSARYDPKIKATIDPCMPGLTPNKHQHKKTPTQELLSANPAGVSWAPPVLQWTLPEELKPGTTLVLKASLPFLTSTTTTTQSWPLRALFKAQSLKVGLTKCGVHLHPVVAAQGGGPYDVEVKPPTRRFRVTANFEP
jgi:hypothetical protein